MTEEQRGGATVGEGPQGGGERGTQDDQERAREFRQQLKQLHAADLAYEMALSLVSFGSQKLGLTEGTAELRDLDDARVSIELLRAVLAVVDDQGGAAPAKELRDTLAQLQLGYVQALQLEEAGPVTQQPQSAGEPQAAEPVRPASESEAETEGGAGREEQPGEPAGKPGDPDSGAEA